MPKQKKWREHAPQYRFSELMKYIYMTRHPTMNIVKNYDTTMKNDEFKPVRPRRNSF